MIFGIGCDLCEVKRIEKCAESFAERCCAEEEREMLYGKSDFCRSLAANFAAKEAFSKALGCGVRGFSLKDAAVMRDELGKPYIKLFGNAEKICSEKGITAVHVSLTHTAELAMAYVILEIG